MSHRTLAITPEAYHEAERDDLGFCTTCGEFTTAGCEPDARDYTCEECGEPTVYGAQEAMLTGLITIDDPGAAGA